MMTFLQSKKTFFYWESHYLASYIVFKAWMTEAKFQSSIHSCQRSEIMLTVQHMWCSENMISEFSNDEAWKAWASEMSSYEAAFDLWKLFRLKSTSYKDCDDSWKETMLKLKLFLYEDHSMSWEKATMSLKKAAESCRITKNFSAKKFFIQSCNDFSIWWLQESWCCILCTMFSEVILIQLTISDTTFVMSVSELNRVF